MDFSLSEKNGGTLTPQIKHHSSNSAICSSDLITSASSARCSLESIILFDLLVLVILAL